jgi:hypothetical protein
MAEPPELNVLRELEKIREETTIVFGAFEPSAYLVGSPIDPAAAPVHLTY